MDLEWVEDLGSWWTTGRAATLAAGIGATSAVVAAFNVRRTLRQSRRDSKARSRPLVVAELRDHPYADATQLLIVRNYGQSVARNVFVTFEPPIPDPEDPSESVTPFLKRRYAKPIAVVAPGVELDNIYFSGRHGDRGAWINAEPKPDETVVTIAYEDDNGNRYSDDFPIDVHLIRNRTYTVSSNDPVEQGKRLVKAVETIAKIMPRVDRSK